MALGKKSSQSPMHQPAVSVLVCAHDERHNLEELLPLLLDQVYSNFEIVVVDDRSNDGTYDYLRKISDQHSRLRLIEVRHKPEHVNGKKFGITLGIKAAKYEWILLTDADCRPKSNHWISEMMKAVDDQTEIVLGFSTYRRAPGLLNAFIRFETLVTATQYAAFTILGRPYMGVGRNLAYKKERFLTMNGFQQHLNITGGDDDLLVNRLATPYNTALSLGGNGLVESIPETSWKAFYIQKLRHLAVGKKYRIWDKLIIGTFSVSWILLWSLIPVVIFSIFWVAIAVILFRWLIVMISLNKATLRVGERFEVWIIPFLDILYPIYYLVTGLHALVSKNVRWKI